MITADKKIDWKYVIPLYLIAFSLSALFNSGWLNNWYQTLTQHTIICDYTYLPACIGTLVAAILALLIDRKYIRTITFTGNNTKINTATALTPIVVFTAIGLANVHYLNEHLFAFYYSIINLMYGTFEEVFWRSYLQDKLRPMAEKFRYVLIGILWWAWHFRFQTVFDFTVFPAICILSSFLIGGFAQKTKSFFVAGSLHCLVILLTNSGGLTHQKIIAGVLTIIVWIAIDKLTKKPEPIPAKTTAS